MRAGNVIHLVKFCTDSYIFQSMGVMAAALVMVSVFVATTAMAPAMASDGYDGTPRLVGMDGQPAMSLCANPAVKYAGKRADCTWYAWENFHFSLDETANCRKLLWSALSRVADPATLEGFTYYTPVNQPEFYDRTYQEYSCLIGCFNLAATASTAPNASPVPRFAPQVNVPLAARTPPAAVVPAAAATVPPSSPAKMAPPPPATLFRPPPPGLSRAPPSIATPPSSTAPTPSMQSPGPVPSQTSAGVRAIRLTSGTSLLVLMAALLLSIGLIL